MSLLWWGYIKTLLLLYSANAKWNNVEIDIAALHIETNGILNTQDDKDLIAESVIDIGKECVRFGMKDVSVSGVTVNTRGSSAFISVVNNILQDKCPAHQFHFIDNSNIKKNFSGKMAFIWISQVKICQWKTFCEVLTTLLKKIKRTTSCDAGLSTTTSMKFLAAHLPKNTMELTLKRRST